MNTPVAGSSTTSGSLVDIPSVDKAILNSSIETSFLLRFENLQHTFQVACLHSAGLSERRDQFLSQLSKKHSRDDFELPVSVVVLSLQFLQFLLDTQSPRQVTRLLFLGFEKDFLGTTDIHSLVFQQPDSLRTKNEALKTYYVAASNSFSSPRPPPQSALLRAAEEGRAQVYAVFGGQGNANGRCISELGLLYSLYQPLLEDLIDAISPLTEALSRRPRTTNFYRHRHMDIALWLRDSTRVPDQDTLAKAAFSFPIIGLVSLAHYCVTCKVLNKNPGEFTSNLQGVSGHSQGVLVAAGIAASSSWESFYENAKLVIEALFWIGYESHLAAPCSVLSAPMLVDSMENGEGQPASLLSVRGLEQARLSEIVSVCNDCLPAAEKIYIALKNARDNFVIAGPAKALHGFNLHLRRLKASEDLDQSRVPYSRRKPVVQHRYLPVSAPFHTPYLESAAAIVKDFLRGKKLSGDGLAVPVYHSKTGCDLRQQDSLTLMDVLVDAITIESVDWPAALTFPNATHIIAFGSGRLGDLVLANKEGEGVRVIMGSDFASPNTEIGTKAELFAPSLAEASLVPTSWADDFSPRLIKSVDGDLKLDTKLTRVLGTPPVMVAGMTPTTVHPDFVSAIMNAGYHVELAGGGYTNAKDMSAAITNIVSSVPSGRGVTCNLIYVSPQAIAWQIPMLRRLVQKGVPIDGLTIGAGVPSPEIAAEYISSLGLRHIAFKPGSTIAIEQVVSIAKAHPSFPIILQWTGGRGGGHHSFEDFHVPILSTYRDIRMCPNIVLVVGSGFGDADGTYPYLTGSWAREFGRPAMPFDGILLGSRMMVATEAHTSAAAKELIIGASGTSDSKWQTSYNQAVGGVITVQSEMGQPIHKIATRGVLLWAELDKKIFSLPRAKVAEALRQNREWIIARLNADFAKPWFAMSSSGEAVELPDMTYGEVLDRLIELMYVRRQNRWIDTSYTRIVFDFAIRMLERIPCEVKITPSMLKSPHDFCNRMNKACPDAGSQQLHPEDAAWFLGRCKARGQKPVNFIPALDENFETWFKKDSLWQSEDIDAVIGQDAGRVCILHGPVSAQYSIRHEQSAKEILDGINLRHIDLLQRELYPQALPFSSNDQTKAPGSCGFSSYNSTPTQGLTRSNSCCSLDSLDESDSISWPTSTSGWIGAVLHQALILQGSSRISSPLLRILQSKCAGSVKVDYQHSAISLSKEDGQNLHLLAQIYRSVDSGISVDLYYPSNHGLRPIILPFKFQYDPSGIPCSLSEVMDDRNRRIKTFYSKLWLGKDVDTKKRVDSSFLGEHFILTRAMLQNFLSTVSQRHSNGMSMSTSNEVFPIDFCITIAWDTLIEPLLIDDIDGDLLRLVHQTNSFEYTSGSTPLQIGDTVRAVSHVQSVALSEAGKSVVVSADIERSGAVVAYVTSTFLFKGSFSDFASTFRHTKEPGMEIEVQNTQDEAILRDREWFILDDPGVSLVGSHLLFQLDTYVKWKNQNTLSHLEATGLVFVKSKQKLQKVGVVDFAAMECLGNPVMEFLSRKGRQTNARVALKHPGWSGTSSYDVKIPSSNEDYAQVSRDYNPIHVSPLFASWADLPGPITHGMYTSAITRGVVEYLAADADSTRFQRWSASFTGMVLPNDELTVRFQHIAMSEGRMVLAVSAFKKGTDDKVLEGEAEIEQQKTAYMFTGQGSQAQGMGLELYNSSPAAKAVWENVDAHFYENFGKLTKPFQHCTR